MPRALRSLPLMLALSASSAFAVFPNNGVDTEYTSVGRFGDASGVAIDTRWVLTAQHVNGSVFSLPGYGDFNVVTIGGVLQNFEPAVVAGKRPDLRLIQVDRDLPFFTKIDTRVPLFGTVDIVGFGDTGTEGGGGYDVPDTANDTRRQASNRIEGLEDISFSPTGEPYWSTMYYRLDSPTSPGRVPNEGGLAGGDSGGGFFYDFGDGARLVATNSAIGSETPTSSLFAYGAYGFGTYLGDEQAQSFLRQYVPQAVVPEPATFAALGLGALAMLRRRKR